MGQFDGIITPQLKKLHKDAINALLLDDALTRECMLVYGSTSYEECPNCIFNTQLKKSSGKYKSGGPIVFTNGQICPYCNGVGSIPKESTESINLLVIWDFKKWLNFDIKVNSPEGRIQTMCDINLISKIKKAKYIIVNDQLTDLVTHKFLRDNEPTPIGFGEDNWIITNWKKE